MDNDLKWNGNRIISYSFINERILVLRLKVKRGNMTVIATYATEDGRKEKLEAFYDTLQKEVDKYIKSDFLIIVGDMNARIGQQPIPKIIGSFGEPHLNSNGMELREFVTFNELKVTNIFFRKKDIHKYTWSARGQRSLLDYLIVSKKLRYQSLQRV